MHIERYVCFYAILFFCYINTFFIVYNSVKEDFAMKKLLLLSVITILLFTSCILLDVPTTTPEIVHDTTNAPPVYNVTYNVGDIGPAGGWIFYDKGEFSDGWRYLEAAPGDIVVDGSTKIVFGLSKTKEQTSDAIGAGKANTAILISAMGRNAYLAKNGSATTQDYAALLCDRYSTNGYSDWFLPSKEELQYIYINLAGAKLGDFTNTEYWSSTVFSDSSVWAKDFKTAMYPQLSRGSDAGARVRPIRAF